MADEQTPVVFLHKVERPTRGLFHEGRHTDYRREMVEMHISEIGFCSGHSASGVFVDEFARTTVPGLYAAGDMASVPHNYMLGAFTNGVLTVKGPGNGTNVANMVIPDVQCTNGVVHVIDRVLLP